MRVGRGLARVVVLIVGLAVAMANVHAQTGGQGSIEGSVTDSSGAVVPGATVTATNQATKVSTIRKATGAGVFTVGPLIPGVYTIAVEAEGFAKLTQENIEVNGLNVTGLNPKLQIGGASDNVTVTDAPPQLQTTSAQIGDVITNDVYQTLPIIMNNQQRDPSSLANLAVGAQSGTRAPIFSGTGNYLAEVYLNGIPTTTSNQQGDNRIIANSVPVESVEQLQIISSGPSAEYQGAGAIGFTIKSGTSKYHGEVVDLIRNTVFDTYGFAGNSLTKTAVVNGVVTTVPAGKPVEHQNELSLSLGGPVPFFHNKFFFFVNFDKYHGTQTSNPTSFTLPTAQMKAGDFTQLNCLNLAPAQQAGCIAGGGPSGNGVFGTSASGANVSNTAFIYNPLSTNCAGTNCSRQPFQANKNGVATNNVIPANYLSPITQYQQKFLPDPNVPGALVNNYVTAGFSGFDNQEIVVRGDYDVTSKQRVSVSYTRGLRQSIGYGSTLPLPYTTGISSILHPTMTTIEHAWTLNSHMVNQFNYGFTRFNGVSLNASANNPGTGGADTGITGLPVGQATQNFPGSTFSGSNAFSSVTQTTWGATGASNASSRTVPTAFTIVDNFQWSLGQHNITLGVQTQWLQDNVTTQLTNSGIYYQTWASNGTANFTGSSLNSNTGYSYASFLIGAVNAAATSVPLYATIGGRFHPVSPYFQDDWKIRPNLTLNLGLRWDYLPPYHEVQDRWSFFNPNATNAITGTPGELQYAGNRGADISCQCRTPVQTWYKNFGPRLGIEFAPDPKTVFRAGFAIAYTRAGGVGGRAGDGNGTGQTGLGSSIILPAAVTSGSTAGPSFYLNNSGAFQAAGQANTNFGGAGFTIPEPTGASLSQLPVGTGNYVNSNGQYVTAGGPAAYADPYYGGRAPEFIFFNLGMQKSLTNALTLTLNYSGDESHFVAGATVPGFWSGSLDPRYLATLGSVVGSDRVTNILNLPATPANVAIAQRADSSVTVPYAGYVANNASSSASISRMLRPFPQYSGTPSPTWDNISNLSYNAFELSLKMREYKGVNFTVNYTYSKNLGDDGTSRAYYAVPAAASSSGVALPGNNRADRAYTITDLPENLSVYGYGKLPFGRNGFGANNWAVREIAGGWTLSGIFRYTSGVPLLITGSGCTAPSQGTCMPDLAFNRDLKSARTADGYGGAGTTSANFGQKNYLDSTAFSPLNTFPLAGGGVPITKIGTAPRDATNLRGPSSYNLDSSVQRSFNLVKERVKFIFRADCFDVTNKVTFNIAQAQTVSATNPASSASSFGRLSGYSGNRRWQFSGHITF